MQKEIDIVVSPKEASERDLYLKSAAQALQIDVSEISSVRIIRRSLDARGRKIKVNLKLQIVYGETHPTPTPPVAPFNSKNVSDKDPVIIVGAGPAGLFAALRLIELGLKPIIIERGKDVSARKRDIALINREHVVTPDSNYCFGEGGAGTFSDGKLYTRSKKRGDNQRIIELLHLHGASEEILYEAHPHIGSDYLPEIITKIRNTILECGGEVHFNTRVTDILITDSTAKGVLTQNNDTILGKAVILATGHSARDIYHILQNNKVLLESKPFAMGVRIEHPQSLINSIQYHNDPQMKYLPSASYNLVHQVDGRGVYSFCMCPGGFIVPASTSSDEIVVNGMSSSLRNSPFANSGMVVEIRTEDLAGFAEYGPLAGLMYQQSFEQAALNATGKKNQTAPAQRMMDFVNNKSSHSLPETSYIPGIIESPLHDWIPCAIRERLQKGFVLFGNKMKKYLTNDAIIVGVESRTSSPVRIPRDKETMQHVQIKNLYPCGEGAGYAGGIISSAVDGAKCAEIIALQCVHAI